MKRSRIIDLPQMRDRIGVFRDRKHAGQVLGEMLSRGGHENALVLAIPAGGAPVAVPISAKLGAPLDLAVVSKITLPWNTEAGYGAVAFDGTVRLNDRMVSHSGLTKAQVEAGIEKTKEKVRGRTERLRGNRPLPELKGRPVILVDDGLASGITLRAAVEAVRREGADQIIIAVPTAHAESVDRFSERADWIYCPNIRKGYSFAVASAYQAWRDVEEPEVTRLLDLCPV